MKRKYQLQFCQLKVGATFGCNGNKCLKVSKRTAKLVEYDRLFYFSKKDIVTTVNPDDILLDGVW